MIRHLAAAAALLSLAASPCLAADLPDHGSMGERRSGAMVGGYLRLQLGGSQARRQPQAGLSLRTFHDYRSSAAPRAAFIQSDSVDLRLSGLSRPTLHIAGVPVTGREARKHQLAGTSSTIVMAAILAAAAVGGYYVVRMISDSGGE